MKDLFKELQRMWSVVKDMKIFHTFKVGHVYKVKRRKVVLEMYPGIIDHYYCTIMVNPNPEKNPVKYLTYIPNGCARPLDNDCCLLKDRLSYVGSYEDYGFVLFNQPNLIGLYNEYKTNIFYTPNTKLELPC